MLNSQLIYTSSDLVNKLSEGDLIEIVSNTSSYIVEPNTQLSTFKVKATDLYGPNSQSVIEIEPNNVDTTTVSINGENDDVEITNTSSANVRWIVRNPSLGLFGSYQHSQAMLDSMKINDFYNNFFYNKRLMPKWRNGRRAGLKNR